MMTSSFKTATAYLSVEFSASLSHIRCSPTVELHISLYNYVVITNAGFILEFTDCHFNYRSNFIYIAYPEISVLK